MVKLTPGSLNFIRSKISELNWIHTMGMRPIGAELAKLEGANAEIVDWAILFHDVAKDSVEFHKHARKSAEICRDYLLDIEMHWMTIESICYCIEVHSWAWIEGDPKPHTIEAKIVFDADMIQQLSPLGIAKHILKYRDEKFSDLLVKSETDLKKAAASVLTGSGKKIARERIKEVAIFFNRTREGS